MSTIQQMIDQLCPNGIEYVRLGDVVKIKNGKDWKDQPLGGVPVYGSGGKMDVAVAFPAAHGPSVLLPRKGSLEVQFVDGDFWNIDTVFRTETEADLLTPRFFYFVACELDLELISSSSTRPSLTQTALNQLEIPLPPLEVQNKIVDYLDTLAAVCDNLDTEISQREQQFEVYRASLISSVTGDEVKLGNLLAYEQPSKYLVKQADYDDTFEVPVLTAGKTFILGYTDETDGIYQATSESPVVIFDDFTTAHKWVDFPFKAKSSAMKMLTPSTDANSFKFIFYSLANIDIDTTDHKRQWISTVSNKIITLPPLTVQEDIANKLDAMQALIDNLKYERELRGQQFEFYRAQLLTFAAKDSTAND